MIKLFEGFIKEKIYKIILYKKPIDKIKNYDKTIQ